MKHSCDVTLDSLTLHHAGPHLNSKSSFLTRVERRCSAAQPTVTKELSGNWNIPEVLRSSRGKRVTRRPVGDVGVLGRLSESDLLRLRSGGVDGVAGRRSDDDLLQATSLSLASDKHMASGVGFVG